MKTAKIIWELFCSKKSNAKEDGTYDIGWVILIPHQGYLEFFSPDYFETD